MTSKLSVQAVQTSRNASWSWYGEALEKEEWSIVSKAALRSRDEVDSYNPKREKNVILMSEQHHSSEVHDEREGKQPEIIILCNWTKGVVDNVDKIVRPFTCQRKSHRWRMIFCQKLLDIAVYNAAVMFFSVIPDFDIGNPLLWIWSLNCYFQIMKQFDNQTCKLHNLPYHSITVDSIPSWKGWADRPWSSSPTQVEAPLPADPTWKDKILKNNISWT